MSYNLTDFLLRERVLTITVFTSIITFQFISTFKINIMDPLLEYLLPEKYFEYLRITIREGPEMQKMPQRPLVIDFGQLLREFFKWLFMIYLLYNLYKYSNIQDSKMGNPGVAIV